MFPTGAIVVVCTEKENMISLDPGLPLGWEGITDPCFTKYSLRVCSSALHTIARCPPGLYGKLHEQYCLLHSCTGSLALLAMGALVAAMSAATAPIPMLRTHSYNMVQPFVVG